MIAGEDLYGWGVCGLPMPRNAGAGEPSPLPPGNPAADLAGHLVHDLSWRMITFSVVMTGLALAGIFLADFHLAAQFVRPEPMPVDIAVRFREEVPAVLPPPVPPPVVKPLPEPPQAAAMPKKPVRPEPPPPVVKPAPRVVQTIPPEPAPMSLPRRAAPPVPSVPGQKAEVALKPAAELPVAPIMPVYQGKRPKAAAGIPSARAPLFRSHPADTLPAGRPHLRPLAERPALPTELPAAPVALSAPADAGLQAVDTGLSPRKYQTPSAAPALPPPVRRENLAAFRPSREDLQPPAPRPQPRRAGRAPAPLPQAGQALAVFSSQPATELALPAAADLVQPAAPPEGNSPAISGTSFDFLDEVAPADLDRSFLVSLNRLRTCLDPGAEIKLKTRLATLLSRPSVCRSGGVLFDIRQPDSAYSIQLDFYNYERKNFPDRCAALRQAVECCEARR